MKAQVKPMKMHVSKEFSFEAAHSLPHLPQGHKCRNHHGHSYRVKVYVGGDVTLPNYWVQDYADIAAATDPIIDRLDHSDLNNVLPVSTAESLAAYLWDQIKPMLPLLSAIEIYETATTCVRYEG